MSKSTTWLLFTFRDVKTNWDFLDFSKYLFSTTWCCVETKQPYHEAAVRLQRIPENRRRLFNEWLSRNRSKNSRWPKLLRFTTHNLALTADITQMYRQIRFAESEYKYHQIQWRDPPHERVKVYGLQIVTYGTAPASFLTTRCLQELALQEQHFFQDIVLRDCYLDSLITGTDSVKAVLKFQAKFSALLPNGGIQLRKWSSNNRSH